MFHSKTKTVLGEFAHDGENGENGKRYRAVFCPGKVSNKIELGSIVVELLSEDSLGKEIWVKCGCFNFQQGIPIRNQSPELGAALYFIVLGLFKQLQESRR